MRRTIELARSWGRAYRLNRLSKFRKDELWNLDHTIANFVLPRLKALRADAFGTPGDLSMDEWDTILGKMVHAFDCYAKDIPDRVVDDQVKEGLALFAEWYGALWQ